MYASWHLIIDRIYEYFQEILPMILIAFNFLICRHTVTRVEIIQSQMLACLLCNLVTLLLLQHGKMLRLLRCTMETNTMLQQLDQLKVLQDKCNHGIQACKQADQRLFQLLAPFLVKRFLHHQVVRYMPPHQCQRVHLPQLLQAWILGECISLVLHRMCDQVVLHLQVSDLLVLHLRITANRIVFLFFLLHMPVIAGFILLFFFCFFFLWHCVGNWKEFTLQIQFAVSETQYCPALTWNSCDLSLDYDNFIVYQYSTKITPISVASFQTSPYCDL